MEENKDNKDNKIIIITTGGGFDADSRMFKNLITGIERTVVVKDGHVEPISVEERAESLGVSLEHCERYAACMCVSVNEYLDMVEALREVDSKPRPSLADLCNDIFDKRPFVPESDDNGLGLTDSEIRKQLKYEKNPMRIKQLNKALYHRKR